MKKIFLFTGLVISLNSFAQVPAYAPTAGLVAFWAFNGNANDVSGNGNNGTVNGAILTTNRLGAGNAAYYFPSTACATNIQATVNTSSITASNAMTVAFWAYRTGNGCTVSALGPGVIEFGNCFATCTDQLEFYWPSSQNIEVEQTFPSNAIGFDFSAPGSFSNSNNTWYHIAYSYDGTTLKYYLNGILIKTVPLTTTFQLNGNVTFGSSNPSSDGALNGKLYDIGLWSRALTDCEIYALYSGDPSSSFAYNPLPDTTLICDSIKLDAGAGYSKYAWSTGDATQTITAKLNGLYKVTVTNSTGCMASDSTFINRIKPSISQKDTAVCAGSSIALSATGISGTSQIALPGFFIDVSVPYTHTVNTVVGMNYVMTVSGIWSVHLCTDPNNVSDAAFYYERTPITALPDNLDLITWNGVAIRPDGNTYNSSHIYNYTLPPATQATQTFTFTDPGTYSDNCNGLTVQISQLQSSNATFTWSANPAATAGLNAADINKQSLTVKPTATTTYYVKVDDGVTSCTDSVLITVATVDTSLTVLDPLMICKNGSGNVRLQAGVASSYKWLLNSVAISGATASNYTATQTGIYSVVVTNSTGCTDTSRIVTVSLYPQPVAGFTINNTSQCLVGNSFIFTNTSTIAGGALSGAQWFFGDNGFSSNTDVVHTYTKANIFSVKLVETSTDGCTDTSSAQSVTVNLSPSTPTISAGAPLSFCQNGYVILNSDAVTGNQWYQNGNIIAGATAQGYTATTTGTYTDIITTSNCSSGPSTGITVTVNPTNPTPTISASGPVSFCQNGGSVTLTSSAATSNQWYQDANLIAGANGQAYTAITAGTYTVIDNTNNCPSAPSAGTVLTINPSPKIQFTAINSVCLNARDFILNEGSETSGLIGTGVYSGDAVFTNNTTPPTYSFSPQQAGTGPHTITYTYTADNGCISDTTQTVTVNSIPVVDFGGTKTILLGDSAQLTPVSVSENGLKYSWSPSLYLSNDTAMEPLCKPTNDIVYTITIKADSLCAATDILQVNVLTDFTVPNTFTPNGDGINDIWVIENLPKYPIQWVQVFDRYGQLLFESHGYTHPWDGTYNGSPLPSGTYYYIIELGDSGNPKTGYVTILR
jgi:gliding motility-associated-like protein